MTIEVYVGTIVISRKTSYAALNCFRCQATLTFKIFLGLLLKLFYCDQLARHCQMIVKVLQHCCNFGQTHRRATTRNEGKKTLEEFDGVKLNKIRFFVFNEEMSIYFFFLQLEVF